MTGHGREAAKAIRRDGAADTRGEGPAETAGRGRSRGRGPRRLRRWAAAGFIACMAVFSAIPLSIGLSGRPNKDYSLWYQVGVAIRQGLDVYPDPASGRLFPFMYPPSAAALLGLVSLLGQHGTTLALVLGHSAAWVGAIALSVWLATEGTTGHGHGKGISNGNGNDNGHENRNRQGTGNSHGGRPDRGGLWSRPLVLFVAPSLCIIALVHNTYLLGQPNLTLLTLLLLAFVCLRRNREGAAGALVATAAAIKAFPILALGYLVYRRHWRASAATVGVLLVWLLVVPLPFRTPAQAVRDVAVWARGMVFTYNPHGIAQRPYRSFSYKNQSIMAMAHRLLRDVPADGEKVLSQHLAKDGLARPAGAGGKGSIDLIAMLTDPGQAPAWDARLAGVEGALARAWRVNVASLGFRTVTAITAALMLGLSLFVAWAMPPGASRSARTDAVEFALVTLLIVMFSPLSFNYAYVWLIYPMTVALHLVQSEPAAGWRRPLELAWLTAVLGIPALALFMPLYAQAYGNLFVPALLLVIGLGARLRGMRAMGKRGTFNFFPRSAVGEKGTFNLFPRVRLLTQPKSVGKSRTSRFSR